MLKTNHLPFLLSGFASGVFALVLLFPQDAPAAPRPPATEKILGGTDAGAGAYPWMVTIAYNDSGSLFDNQFCGGALIAPTWVLTAAHCVEGETRDSIDIWVGVHDLDSTGGAVNPGVAEIIRHPNYRADQFDNLFSDVALIRLSSPVTGVAPVELASTASNNTVGSSVRVIGWGALDDSNDPFYPSILQQADLEIVGLAGQQTNYQNTLDSQHLAAAFPPNYTKDSCGGDSGGPLFRTINNQPVVVGVVSFGLGCAEQGIAGIYANVLSFRLWIDGVLASSPTTGNPNATLIDSLNNKIRKLKKKLKRTSSRKSRKLKKKLRKLRNQLSTL